MLRYLIPDTPQHTRDIMTRKNSIKKTVAEATQSTVVAVPLPLTFASPLDFGKAYEVLCARHESETRPMRDWFLGYVTANFAVITMAKPRKDESGNALMDKEGKPLMAQWTEYDVKGDDVRDLRKAICTGMTVAACESGAYDVSKTDPTTGKTETVKASDILKLAALPKEQRTTLKISEEAYKAAVAVAKRVTNTVDAYWARGPLQWLKSANAANRATATGEKREKSPRFAVLIGKGGKLRKLLERARARSEKDGYADTCSESQLIEALDTLI